MFFEAKGGDFHVFPQNIAWMKIILPWSLERHFPRLVKIDLPEIPLKRDIYQTLTALTAL